MLDSRRFSNHHHACRISVQTIDRMNPGYYTFPLEIPRHRIHQRILHSATYREYIAIAEGNITEDSGIIDEPVGRKEGSIVEWTVRRDGKTARTEFAVIERNENFTVLRLHLLTGRTHQIRVHLSHAGHPLLGDDLYGGDIRLIDRQALHAFSVRFTHPETGETLYYEAPLPEDMQKLITKETEKMMKYSEYGL